MFWLVGSIGWFYIGGDWMKVLVFKSLKLGFVSVEAIMVINLFYSE